MYYLSFSQRGSFWLFSMDKTIFLSLVRFFSLDEIPKIKIFHLAAKEHPGVIEGRRRLIAVDVLDSGEADVDASIDHDDVYLDEEYVSGLVGAGVTEEVEDMQKSFNYSSLLYYMLKPYNLLTQGFGKNSTAQEKLLKHMCSFGSRA